MARPTIKKWCLEEFIDPKAFYRHEFERELALNNRK